MGGFDSHWNTGIFQYEAEDFEGMIDSFTKYINEENPQKSWLAEAYYFIGLGHYNLNRFGSALKYFSLALDNNASHNYFSAVYNRALCYMELEHDTLAIDDFTRAIEIDPAHTESYLFRSQLYKKKGFGHDALDDLKTALSFDKKDVKILGKVIFACIQLKKYEEAIYYINEQIYLQPKTSHISYYNRANSYLLLKKYDLAINDFDRAIEIDNSTAHFYFTRGLCYFEMKNPKSCDDWKVALEKGFDKAAEYIDKYCKQ